METHRHKRQKIPEPRHHNCELQRHRLPMRPSRRDGGRDKKAVTISDQEKLNLFDVLVGAYALGKVIEASVKPNPAPSSKSKEPVFENIIDAEFEDIKDMEIKALVLKS